MECKLSDICDLPQLEDLESTVSILPLAMLFRDNFLAKKTRYFDEGQTCFYNTALMCERVKLPG